MQVLLAAHPGWREVEELNSALTTADYAKPGVPRAETVSPITYPPPLNAKLVSQRNAAADESRRIEAIREPALERIERLKRTSGLRMERNITRYQADVETKMQTRLADNAQKLAQRNTDEKAAIRKAAHANIRDLGLHEIALGSELDSLALFPGLVGSARAEAQKSLAAATAKRKAAENELAEKLHSADDRYKAQLAESSERIHKAAEQETAAFKQAEQERVAADVARNKNEVESVLSVLAPLESPLSVKSATVTMQKIPPLVIQPGSVIAVNSSDASLRRIREQRDRLIEFIRQDVTRRIARLSAVNHWQISTSYSPFLPDKSKEVADLLRMEWSP